MSKTLLKKCLAVAATVLVIAGLYSAYHYHYLLFHSVSELYSVIIACSIFMLTWNSRRMLDNQYLLLLGIAYLFVGLLDLVHIFTYQGMNFLPGYDANTPTQLWIAARYIESLSLLAAPVMFFRRLRPVLLLAIYTLVTGSLLLSIITWDIFPDCFLENAGGLTEFKIYSEYIISMILVLAGLLVIRFRHKFDTDVLVWMLISIFLTILGEIAFTTYASTYSLSNMIGHVLKIGSFYCVYRALIVTGLVKPYELLFRDLNLSRENYRSLFTNMSIGFARHRMVYDDNERPVDYRFLEVNDAFKRLTGLDDVTGKLATEVIPGVENDPADWIGVYGRVASEGEPVQFENYAKDLDRWYSVTAYSPAKGDFVAIFDDISSRKQSEAELSSQRESLRISEARFKLLSTTAGRLLASDKPEDLINDLCSALMKHLDCQVFFNYLADESSARLCLNAWSGITSLEAKKIQWLACDATICGDVVRENNTIIAEDIANKNEKRIDHIKAYGIQAYCCHPLMVGERLVGTLSFGTSTRPRFKADEVELMRIVTDQVALAIQREWTEESLRHHNEEMERTVQERTCELSQLVSALKEEVELRKTAEKSLYNANVQLTDRANQLRRLAAELTAVEQRERRRLAQVLHDGLQQYLAIAKLQLSGLIEDITEDHIKQDATNIESSISESIQISRSLSADLSPPALYEGGLATGLKWLASWMQNKHKLHVSLGLEDTIELPENVKVLVFESVRELLFNTVKHAGVSQAHVGLESMDGQGARIIVSDLGKGFSIADTQVEGDLCGFGLFSIRERIELIGGTFDIDSAPGRGSRFTMLIPYACAPTPLIDGDANYRVGTSDGKQVGPYKQTAAWRVMVVDDHSLFRDGTVLLINAETDMEVVAQACDGLEACRLALEHNPDVILMDINLPDLNGIEATQRIHRDMPQIRIIALSMHDNPNYTEAMHAAGAVDYITKDCHPSEIIKSIRMSLAGTPPPSQTESINR